MFENLKKTIIQKFLIKFILQQLDKILAKLPGNEAKTVVGVLIIITGMLLQNLPEGAEYLAPLLDYLKKLPAEQITAVGLMSFIVGIIHKITKFVVSKFGGVPSRPIIRAIKNFNLEETNEQ